jgi:ethanolamine permease
MKISKEFFFYISVVVGMAISSSSFTMISGLYELVNGYSLLIALFVGALFCLAISLSVSELASIYPASPGVRTYLHNAFGNNVSLVFVYLYLCFIIMIGSVESYTFGMVVNYVFPTVDPSLVIVIVLSLVIIVNLFGVEFPKYFQMISTFILLLCLLFLGYLGITHETKQLNVFTINKVSNEITQIVPAVTMAIFLFVGFEWVTPLGKNKKSYENKIPFSMPVGIILNLVVYTLLIIGLSFILSQKEIIKSTIPQMSYSSIVFGRYGLVLALFVSFLAVISTFNAGIMGGARLIYALSREGHFPKFGAKISLNNGVPYGSIIFLGCSVLLLSLFVGVYKNELVLAIVGSSFICFIYAALMLSCIRIRRKRTGAAKPPFENKLPILFQYVVIILLPIIGILSLFSIQAIIIECIVCFFWVVTLVFLFSIYMRKNNRIAKR